LETTNRIDYVSASAVLIQTEKFPDGSKRLTEFNNGRVKAVTNFNNLGTQAANVIGWTTNDYDKHFRLWTVTDGRNGPTTNVYYNDDRLYWTSTPAPDANTPPKSRATFTTTATAAAESKLPRCLT